MNNPPVSSADIREAFLQYFVARGHERVKSSSLIPANDPTLLFTNAGMVPFKDVFLGQEKRPYQRATSSQRCVRAGGKHNDLENVGYTARHHTFFEMLGNFSFGDYFKVDAIRFAWEFLTGVLGLPEEKLWVTVHISDDEAERIWKDEIGISPERFSKLDADNFWQMGDTGPCGPSSEIFYDHGESIFGDPPGGEHDDGDRYIEIWNLVFMQYVRSNDGQLTPLPNPSIDTGMGLERIAAVMQGVHNNYDIDLFKHLLAAAAEILSVDDTSQQSLRVIVDHIRSCAFLIVDGVVPSNEGRGYVLRRIMRRAIRHGNKLGAEGAFFYRLAKPLVEVMGNAYPELQSALATIESTIINEEEQFAKTLDKGMIVLEEALQSLKGQEIPGDVVFKLYDTFGFPVDLTNDIARERGYTLDIDGYEQAMQRQRQRSKDAGNFQTDYTDTISLAGETTFTGYDKLDHSVEVIALFDKGNEVERLNKGQSGTVILSETPFYAESGGQVGDAGWLLGEGFKAKVNDVQKQGDHHAHYVDIMDGSVGTGDVIKADVDSGRRQSIVLNHSATHLLHAALREVLGHHVMQKGSLNDAQKLRFDFAHSKALTADELTAIEDKVNAEIRLNSIAETELTDMAGAEKKGALALFGEKYGDEVRLLSMGNGFSVELCGGTHVERTGDIGLFKIMTESGVAAGVRRIEAVTGANALNYIHEKETRLQTVTDLLKAGDANLLVKVTRLLENQKQQEKQIQQLQGKLAMSSGSDLTTQAVMVGDIQVLAARLDGVDRKGLLSAMDDLKNKLGTSVVLLSSVDGKGISLVAGVSKNLTNKVQAGQLMKDVADKLGGKGGGRPDMAQGGGQNIEALPGVLAGLPGWVEKQLGET